MRDGQRHKLHAPTCFGCACHFSHSAMSPIKRNGVTMHFGENFCTAGKRARRFKKSDPKTRVPDWCPKRKTPCELRIYFFKDVDTWMLHDAMCASLGQPISPNAHRYALCHELKADLTPQKFWKRIEWEDDTDLFPVPVRRHSVIEIDDGIKPMFFYKTDQGYRLELFFDTATAKKNVMEDTD